MRGYEKLDINMLEQAYERRLGLMHDFLYKAPMKMKRAKKKEKTAHEVDNNVVENSAIYETTGRAKRLKKDLIEELQCIGIQVLEVII